MPHDFYVSLIHVRAYHAYVKTDVPISGTTNRKQKQNVELSNSMFI